jgi:4-coumarate--CoA ligase
MLDSIANRIQIRLLALVPPVLVQLAKAPIVADYDLRSVEVILTGAAPAGIDLCDEVRQRLPHLRFIMQGNGIN